jgi:hypothetical protein
MSVASPVVERKTHGYSSQRARRLSHSDNGRLSTPWREVIFL